MSGFIGGALPTNTIRAKDVRFDQQYRRRFSQPRVADRSSAFATPAGYANDFWPGGRGFYGEQGVDVTRQRAAGARPIERIAHGIASRVGIAGTTRDQYGAPLPGVTVVLHRTSTRELVHEMVSDGNGAYLSQTIFAGEAHYIYFHKAGAIDVFGATDNDLIGA